jgi:xylan 1,4-beta-xylosidase
LQLRLTSALLPRFVFAFALLLANIACAQETPAPKVKIQVDCSNVEGQFQPAWNYFGYDEPNYTYAANGQKLLKELRALSSVPVYVRMHNLLTSGDGSASLKWGSTNVYTEDATGKPVYDWRIVDRIFDTLHAVGVKPLVEIGFMPEALSTHPQPYRHNFPKGTIYTGWAYPPKDYGRWSELVFQFVRHLRERFGDAEVSTWLWEVWNEPDIGYWQGTPEEYFKLFDYTVDAALKAIPNARIGGPHSTGPGNPKAAEFLRSFFEHCAHQKNYATGKIGTPLRFIAFHAKGSPKWRQDHVQMEISGQLASIERGFRIISSFPEWRHTPVILGESDPEGCAACSARDHPQNAYRNTALYASYTAEVLHHTTALAQREKINFSGMVTWAFEFEEQPYFAGFRELASNGVDKPVLNAFRMFGLLGSEQVKVSSSEALSTEQVIRDGVRERPDINAMAMRKERELEVLIWHYDDDDDVPARPAEVELSVRGLPTNIGTALLEHFRIDGEHSNAYSAWQEMGSPESPSQDQYEHLQAAGQLQLLTSPNWITLSDGSVRLQFSLPRQGISLIRMTW